MAEILLTIAGLAFFLLMLGVVAAFSRLGRANEHSESPGLAVVQLPAHNLPMSNDELQKGVSDDLRIASR